MIRSVPTNDKDSMSYYKKYRRTEGFDKEIIQVIRRLIAANELDIFTVRGDKGDKGDRGDKGDPGEGTGSTNSYFPSGW